MSEDFGPGHERLCELALRGGVRVVQFRDKELDREAFVALGRRIFALCRRHGALFIVNDRVEEALEIGADGVHVGQRDMPVAEARAVLGEGAIVGLSVGSVEEAIAGERDGADYVAVSPVFDTATKPDAGGGLGLEMVRSVRRAVRVPVAAIGGITAERLAEVVAAGADLVAVVSAISRAEDPERAAAELVREYEKTRGKAKRDEA